MPIIQDPRMNAREEALLGIAYFEVDFILNKVNYQSGHYFYKKDNGNPNQPFNSRYLPHGFPVVATNKVGIGENDISPAELERYKKMFPNLIYTYAFKIDAHPDAIKEDPPGTFDIDGSKPMAAYMNKHVSDQAKGLKNFERGQPYRYNRGEDTLQTN